MITTVGPFTVHDYKTHDGRVLVDLHMQGVLIRMSPESLIDVGRMWVELGESYYPPEELRR